MSIKGTVLATKGELLQLHLEIDPKPTGEYWYRFAPTTGNMMYCMPKVETEVVLYFEDEEESHAEVIGCVRKNGKTCTGMSDPNVRQFTTEHGKMMKMAPNMLCISGKQNTLNLLDKTELQMQSGMPIQIISKKGILLKAKNIAITCGTEFAAHKTNAMSALRADGTTI